MPLSLDEAKLALNISARSYLELLQPLDHDQSAPPLFLWIQHTAVLLLGVDDSVLRLVPLVCGIALILLASKLLRRLIGRGGALTGAALVAFSPVLIYYSSSVKQYGVEAFLTVLMLRLALDCRDAAYGGSARTRLALIGAVIPWLAAPGVFVLAGICGMAAVAARVDRRARQVVLWTAPAWAASFALAYLVAYRPASRNIYLQHYWEGAFVTLDPGRLPDTFWAIWGEDLWGLTLGYPVSMGHAVQSFALLLVIVITQVILLIAGARCIQRRHGLGVLVMTAGPLFAALAASLLGLYPVSLRLMLFAAPLIQLIMVAGLELVVSRWSEPHARRAWMGTASVVALPLLAIALLEARRVNPAENVRALVQELSRYHKSGEPVYIFAGSIPPYAYYSTDWNAPDQQRLELIARVASSGGPAFENAPSRSRPVQNEGDGLHYRTILGVELYGISTGIEWKPRLGPLKRSPDAGWAENEARRVETLRSEIVWVVISHTVGGEWQLLREIERRGARSTHLLALNDATLVRYRFGPVTNRSTSETKQ